MGVAELVWQLFCSQILIPVPGIKISPNDNGSAPNELLEILQTSEAQAQLLCSRGDLQ